MNVHSDNITSVPILTPDGNEGGRLYFVPYDANMAARIANAQERFRSLFEPLSNVALTVDGRGADGPSEALVGRLEAGFADLLDYACGVQTAHEALKQFSAFCPMSDGTLWASAVIATLCAVMNTVMDNCSELVKTMKRKRR